ncbi:MAG: nucleotidyltransferase family protein [Betaproteobacteria bacterium]|nr:nucleotidyltransferase family protein [Betaproteobacteria bacterium]
MRIVGILLAAGAGTRFGGGKLSAPLSDGTTVGHRACANLAAALPEVIAVVRPGDEDLARELAATGARVTVCPGAHAGMGASLAHGVEAAGDADAVLIALADMPWIRPDTFSAVAAALARGEQVVVPRHQGKRGHPVGFGRAHFPALRLLGDDQGARDVIARATGICWIEVDDPGVLRDVDTPADLEAPRS